MVNAIGPQQRNGHGGATPDMRSMLAARAVHEAAAPAHRTKVDIRNLDFFYGRSQALKNVTLSLRDRHVTALIGPSGCRKSTLIRIINRLHDLYPDQRARSCPVWWCRSALVS